MCQANASKTIWLLPNVCQTLEKVAAIEVNISCPNVKQGGMAYGTTLRGRV